MDGLYANFGMTGKEVVLWKRRFIELNGVRVLEGLAWLRSLVIEYSIDWFQEECVCIEKQNSIVLDEFPESDFGHDFFPSLRAELTSSIRASRLPQLSRLSCSSLSLFHCATSGVTTRNGIPLVARVCLECRS